MNISKESIDALNAVITLVIDKKDYQPKVDEALNNYRKNAVIPGFRKGHVPMGMVKKQYGRAIQVDEVNKLISQQLNEYITQENLDLLGQPLPKEDAPGVDWDAPSHTFVFEIGLAPEFSIDLSTPIDYYEIQVTDKEVSTQIEHLRTRFGSLVPCEAVTENAEITGTFFNEKENIDKEYTFTTQSLTPEALEQLKGKQVGDQLTLSSKNLFKDAHVLMQALAIPHEVVHTLDIDLTFTIENIQEVVLATLDEAFFNQLYPNQGITTEEAFREKVAEGIREEFLVNADQRLLDDATEVLLEKTHFELPAAFLKKWIRVTSEEKITQEQADQEYERSEKGLRYQLIEGKIIKDNNLQVTYPEIRTFAENAIRAQIARYGLTDVEQTQIDSFVNNTLKNEQEVNRIHRELIGGKLIAFYKEKANLNKISIDVDSFIEKFYTHQHHH